MYGPLTEPETDIPTRPTETNNEITRAGLSGRDNREFGAESAERGRGRAAVGVARDIGGETEPRQDSSQLVASSGVCTKKADVVSVGFVS